MSGKKLCRGEIYWVNLDPTVGVETKKKRPCLIISNDILNEMSDVVIVAPITSQIRKIYSCEVKSLIAKKIGKVILHQCRAIDKSRIEEKLDHLDFDVMKLVDEAIKVTFGLS